MVETNPELFLEKIDFETVACDFCGDSDSIFLFEGPDRAEKLPGSFRLVTCKHCGMIRQNPRPTPETISYYYPTQEYEPYLRAIAEEPSLWRRLNRSYGMYKRWRCISAYKRQGKILDIGCAAGNFLYEMHRHGHWDVQGIERNTEMVQYARSYYGFDIHRGTLESFVSPPEVFDVITLWHVLEHMHYPQQALERIYQLLKPGGLLVFSIPNLQSIGARIFGHHWFGWELPRHLYHFPENVLENWLKKAGFKLHSVRCIGASYEIFTLSLLQHLEASTGVLSPVQSYWIKMIRAQPTRVVFGLPFWLIDRFKLGAIHTYCATKDEAR